MTSLGLNKQNTTMMKNLVNLIFTMLLLVATTSIFGQTTKHGNEWIDASKTYFRLKVAKDGVYRVTYDQLAKAGFPANARGVDLKLINIGVEKPIYVSDNNSFDSGDFLEFYGEAHTIGVDTFLYSNWREDMFNPRYSLTSDTNVYYLTLSPQTINARVINFTTVYNTVTQPVSPFCIYEEAVVFKDAHYKPSQFEIRQSVYSSSEGFGSTLVQSSGIVIKGTKAVPSTVTSIKPTLRFRLGNNEYGGKIEARWNDRVLGDFTTMGLENIQKTYALEISDIIETNSLGLRNIQSNFDRHRVAYATLTYARNFDFGTQSDVKFNMPSATTKRNMFIKKGPSAGFAYDIVRNVRYNTEVKNGETQLLINGALAATTIFVPGKFDSVATITKFVPKVFADTKADYVIISNEALQGSGKVVDQYAAYRSSNEGGGYKTTIIDANDLYDHFSYGILYHSMSIKNFAGYMDDNWTDVKFINLLGKGLEYQYMRRTSDIVNNVNKRFFVPTYGNPGSDILMVSDTSYHAPRFAVGRVAAKTDWELSDYLDKVKEYEGVVALPQDVPSKAWTKNVLHLGGGKNEGEQTSIKNGLEAFAGVIRDTTFGGNIMPFYKNSFDAVQFTVNQEINNIMNNGISIINFFGHSASSSWDFSLQNPKDFKNKGKYPFITSFGCYSGNLHAPSVGISESFVIQPAKAGIAFYASTGTAFIGSLTNYGRKFYKAALQTHRHLRIGEVMKYVAENATNVAGAEYALYTQLTYHGDPALSFYLEDVPDYTFDYASVKLNPTAIQTATPEIKVNLNIVNLGKHVGDSIDVVFYHELPNGKNADTIEMRIAAKNSLIPVSFAFKSQGIASLGRNVIYGIIDPKNKIYELPAPDAENNNTLRADLGADDGFEFFVNDNIASPIYPPNYAMINTTDHFILKASTPAAPLSETTYLIQLDTTKYFNSPLLEKTQITSIGGYIEYKPTQSPKVNQVYYWRISPDSLPNTPYKWSNSSFAFIPSEPEGWNQSHFFQFTEDSFKDLTISEETKRDFVFGIEKFTLKYRNKIFNPNDLPHYIRNNVTFGSFQRVYNYTEAGFAFFITDRIKGEISNQPGGAFGSLPPTLPASGAAGGAFAFNTKTPEDRKKIMDFINSQFTTDRTISVLSILPNNSSDMKISEWENDKNIYGTNLFEVFEKIGAQRFKEFKNLGSVPYVFIAEKNRNNKYNTFDEQIAITKDEIIEGEIGLDAIYKKQGNVTSTIVGPAKTWDQLKFHITEKTAATEKSYVDIFGIKPSGQEVKLDSNVIASKSITNIDATLYPNLRLVNTNFDTTDVTAAQLNFWRISFTGFADAAIALAKEKMPTKFSIDQGETFKVDYNIKNAGIFAMDSILVKYTLTNRENKSIVYKKRLGKLPFKGELNDVFTWEADQTLSGTVTLVIDVNPDKDQPELYTFNNRLAFILDVARDKRNPNLLVYFDGVQILDGDIVAPSPEIKITLKDDNPSFPITDINKFELSIDTGFNQIKVIPLNASNVKFVPATATNGEAQLIFSPTLADGDYTLIVQGKDMADNLSGANAKTVNFKVITEEAVSQVLNYPNPFSTSTEFIFTLTGQDVPDQMSISIMTLSGKVVKEITQEELGPMRIGINRSSYKWNGTDEYGEKLANGVYLYRVNFRNSAGEQYKKRSEGKLDTYFKHNIGKLVIMR